MAYTMNQTVINALRTANRSLALSTQAIRDAYAEAERTDDYSDADELAADYRESLHDDFTSLMGVFAAEYPDLFN